MKRQQAFVSGGKMLKGALHAHTTRSDGEMEPADVIRLHERLGYDFLALTDHRIYNYRNFAPETSLTILPGMEFDGTFERGQGFRCFHTVCLGPSREDGNGFEQDERPKTAAVTGQDDYQPYLDAIHAKGNLTIHCHPEWSGTPARCFDRLKGNFALEIYNSGCAIHNHMDRDASCWDELLGQGLRIYGVAVDDGHERMDHGNGWVRVDAENTIPSILKALKEGRFYSSCGPEIYDFTLDGDRAIIDCSPVSVVRLHSDMHPTRLVTDADGLMTHAEIRLNHGPEYYRYVRMTIIDKDGKHAWTNPIWTDD